MRGDNVVCSAGLLRACDLLQSLHPEAVRRVLSELSVPEAALLANVLAERATEPRVRSWVNVLLGSRQLFRGLVRCLAVVVALMPGVGARKTREEAVANGAAPSALVVGRRFGAIVNWPASAQRQLLRRAWEGDLRLALHACSEQVRVALLRHLSRAERRRWQRLLEASEPFSVAEIEAAQERLLALD